MNKLLVLFFIAVIGFTLSSSAVFADEGTSKPQEEEEPDCE